mmetsp:Transcript_126061/g.251686  ORF Transcript_126061/g.251686 Transcript_126061/m.251686 type:complete len:225 (+) Transcript_126061:303-977(+)
MVSLTMLIASSSVSYGIIDRTGPNISSLAMVIPLCTLAKTVGFTKKPSSNPGGFPGPPVTKWAPSSRPCLRYRCTCSHCMPLTTGPMSVPGSLGSPTTMLSAKSLANCTASLYCFLGTSIRLKALQDWPVLCMSCCINVGTADGRSASSSSSAALFPPSSVFTCFSVCEPTSLIRLPARVEPVKVTISTSGCAAKGSPHVGPSPITILKTPGGNPASCTDSATR